MSAPIIVLKFGGSVLRDSNSYGSCIHEIYRWRREGYRVVAVVSALQGRTDQLLARAHSWKLDDDPFELAPWLAQGESECALELLAELRRSGTDACILSPEELSLRAEGHPLESQPVHFHPEAIHAAHAQDQVVILPGYCGLDAQGRRVVFGRGGSDLTALFVAQQLNAATCRLIKDVDGLYDRDPVKEKNSAKRFERAHWSDALETDGSVLQHKAVRFAQEHELAFEVGALQANHVTTIGPDNARLGHVWAPAPRLRIALLGLGTVGEGVRQRIESQRDSFSLVACAVREPKRYEHLPLPEKRVFGNVFEAIREDVDVVIETTGGMEPAYGAIREALRSGRHVITANKSVVARHGPKFRRLAHQAGVTFAYSATVGGSLPILERLQRRSDHRGTRLRGLLNGTSQWIANEVSRGLAWDEAIAEAVEQGFAERDPNRDLSGLDSAEKLSVISQAMGIHELPVEAIPHQAMTPDWFSGTDSKAKPKRSVARLERRDGKWRAAVSAEKMLPGDPLYGHPGAWNACCLQGPGGYQECIKGLGAGRWPTAESIMGDLWELYRKVQAVPARVHVSR